jgi:hypothetical protein
VGRVKGPNAEAMWRYFRILWEFETPEDMREEKKRDVQR